MMIEIEYLRKAIEIAKQENEKIFAKRQETVTNLINEYLLSYDIPFETVKFSDRDELSGEYGSLYFDFECGSIYYNKCILRFYCKYLQTSIELKSIDPKIITRFDELFVYKTRADLIDELHEISSKQEFENKRLSKVVELFNVVR